MKRNVLRSKRVEPKLRVEVHDMWTGEFLLSHHAKGGMTMLKIKQGEYPERIIEALENALDYARAELGEETNVE
jgi:hypothetical protein